MRLQKDYSSNVKLLGQEVGSTGGVIYSKAGKAAALPKSSDTLTLSQSGGADYAQPLDLPHLKKIVITPLYQS